MPGPVGLAVKHFDVPDVARAFGDKLDEAAGHLDSVISLVGREGVPSTDNLVQARDAAGATITALLTARHNDTTAYALMLTGDAKAHVADVYKRLDTAVVKGDVNKGTLYDVRKVLLKVPQELEDAALYSFPDNVLDDMNPERFGYGSPKAIGYIDSSGSFANPKQRFADDVADISQDT